MVIRLSMEFGTWRECFDFVQGFPRINAAEGEEEEEVKEEKPVKKLAKEKEAKEKSREVKEKSKEVKEKPKEEPKEELGAEELIVKTRAALREAVQKAGKNIAAEWVHEKGFESFKDIKSPEILKELLEKAGEYNAK